MHITILVLIATVALFISGKYRTDLIALCAMLALMLTGVLTPQEAFSGFGNTVIFVIAGMFIVSGSIVRTGLAGILSNKILGVAGNSTTRLFMLVMLLAALIGSLVSNTGTVAIMMPIVVAMSRSINESPSRFLMPLAFMSSIGGMFTLIGNSPNMVVSDALAKAGFPPLTLFSFLPVGAACFVFGMLILAPAMSVYLSRRKNARVEADKKGPSTGDLARKYHLDENMYEIAVPPASTMAGLILADLRLPERYGAVVQEMWRDEPVQGYFGVHHRKNQFAPGPQTAIKGGDVLRVLGTPDGVRRLVEENGLHLSRSPDDGGSHRFRFAAVGVCELVLMSSSRLINLTIAESDLRKQWGVTVLGIQRGDQYLLENLKDQTMHSGDSLLVQGSWEDLARLGIHGSDWVLVGSPGDQAGRGRLRRKIPLVAAVLVLMLAGMATGLLPTVTAVTLASVVLIFGGCFKNMDEAYGAINWETLVLIACLMPMALAMEKTGVVGLVSDRMVVLCADYGPYVALAVVYAVTSFMNILISTTPVALLVSPVALHIAAAMDYSPLPFMFAVATAASMCFASPFSTPSNALVMSAGRYTFSDYMKIGLPLQIAMGVVMVFVLPWLFPFVPPQG